MYDPVSRKTHVNRDVVFLENQMSLSQNNSLNRNHLSENIFKNDENLVKIVLDANSDHLLCNQNSNRLTMKTLKFSKMHQLMKEIQQMVRRKLYVVKKAFIAQLRRN